MTAPDPTAGERGIEFPAHHIVGVDLGFTCTNCGGHTSLTPPCIPARTYPLPTSPPAVAASTGTSEDVEALAEVIAGIDGGRLADASTRAHDACLRAARAVLASDWLAAREAARDRRVRAEALREAADEAYARFVSGKTLGAPTDVWLRDRADRIEADA